MTHETGDADDSEDLSSLVSAGTEVVGSVSGAGVGLLLGGPAGALVGAAAAPVVTGTFRSAGREFKRRWLSRREEGRVGGVLMVAAEELERRVDEGASIREDWFPPAGSEQPTEAKEAVEQAILIARDAAEEKKVAIIGRLLASLCLDSTLSSEQAQHYLSVARALTYRQLMMLALFGLPRPVVEHLRDAPYDETKQFSSALLAALSELLELSRMGLVSCKTFPLSVIQLVPAEVRTQGVGAQVHNLARLGEHVDDAAINALFQLFSGNLDQQTVS